MADPVALQIQPQNGLTSLGQIMGIANSATELQRNRATLQDVIARTKAERITSEVGAERAQRTLEPEVTKAEEGAKQSKLETAKKHLGFNEELLNKSDSHFASIMQSPEVKALSDPKTPDESIPALQEKVHGLIERHLGYVSALVPKEAPEGAMDKIRAGADLYHKVVATDPRGLQQFVAQQQQSRLGAEGQVAQGQIPAGSQQQVSVHPVTQSLVTTGKDQFGNVTGATPTPTGGGVPSLQPGQPAAITLNAETMGKDYAARVAESKNAAQDIGVLQEIKKYAPDAITGVGGDKRQLVNGFVGWLLSKVPGAEQNWFQENKTNTDLLAKNSTMLAIAGGDTNLAKTMAEAMNPNTHMTPKAIAKAADQVMAQRKMSAIKAEILQPYATDPQKYSQVLTEVNRLSDPRVLQYPNMTPKEKAELKKNMTPSQANEFGESLQFFQKLGHLK